MKLGALALAVALLAASPAPLPSPFRIAIDASAFAGLARVSVNATDEAGHTSAYGGIALRDLVARAGAPAGHDLRGRAMTAYLVVGAADGYRVVLALPDIDASFTDRLVVLADTRDGAPLPADEAPRLIVPGEKRAGRWVKHVTSVELQYAATP